MANYETAVAQMYALGHELAQTPSHKFDLAHIRVLLAALEHPENRFPTVLVAGTNGKGSTAATLASILQASGLKTGLYTSPHLVRINERIRLNGEAISDAIFDAGARAVNAVPYMPPVSPGSPSCLSSEWTADDGQKSGVRNRYPLEVMGTRIMVESPLVGRHQLRNLALAIAAAGELHTQGIAEITSETIAKAVS